MPDTTGRQIVTDALVTLNIVKAGASVDAGMMDDGFRRLNQFVGSLALQTLTIPAVVREVFALTAELGTYTIGPGGDFDTLRPSTKPTGASLLLNNNLTPVAVTSITSSGSVATVTTTADHGAASGQNVTINGADPAAYNGTFPITVTGVATFTYVFTSAATSATGTITAFFESNDSQTVEQPCPIVTDDAWQWTQIKSLTSTLFTSVYYNPTYAGGLGTVSLWPIPTVTTNALVLYTRQQLRRFSSLTATYALPEGTEEMFVYGLAKRLLTPYAVTDEGTVGDVQDMARTTLGNYKRSNVKIADLPTDPALTMSNRGIYNIITNQGG